jgi:hypothetical protein
MDEAAQGIATAIALRQVWCLNPVTTADGSAASDKCCDCRNGLRWGARGILGDGKSKGAT